MHRLWILHSSWPTDYFEMLKVGSLILVILQRVPNSLEVPLESGKLETLNMWSKCSPNTSWAFSLATSTGSIGLLWVSDIIARTTLHTHQGTSWLNTEACCWSSAYSSFSLHTTFVWWPQRTSLAMMMSVWLPTTRPLSTCSNLRPIETRRSSSSSFFLQLLFILALILLFDVKCGTHC